MHGNERGIEKSQQSYELIHRSRLCERDQEVLQGELKWSLLSSAVLLLGPEWASSWRPGLC